jgi:hypothetical protein
MPIEITTEVQLKSLMGKIVRDVIEEVSDEMLRAFKEDFIDVYALHKDNKIYRQTGEFRNEAWDWEAIKQTTTEVSRKFLYDGMKMSTHNTDEYISSKSGFGIGTHGSSVWGWDEDERPYLADTLNKTRPSSSLWLSRGRSGAYWDEFISQYVRGGKLKLLLDATFSKYGIKSG